MSPRNQKEDLFARPSVVMNSFELTSTLLSLSSLEPASAVPYIKHNYAWDVVASEKKSIARNPSDEELLNAAVTVEIKARTVLQTDGVDEFPVYGEWMSFGKKVLGDNVAKSVVVKRQLV